jgi:hypothetical protein
MSSEANETKLSFLWFLVHGACYINGGLTFLIGSILYYPQYNPPLSHEDGDREGSLLFRSERGRGCSATPVSPAAQASHGATVVISKGKVLDF